MSFLSVRLLTMRRALYLSACMLAIAPFLSGTASAQSAAASFVPPECVESAQTPSEALGKRKGEIEALLAKLRGNLSAAANDEGRKGTITREIYRQQGKLIEVLFALDCKKDPTAHRQLFKKKAKAAPPVAERSAPEPTEAAPPPVITSRGLPPPAPPPTSRGLPPPSAQPSGPPAADQARVAPQAVEVTTYYATNRKLEAAPRTPGETYGLDARSVLTFGRAVVSIPANHTTGNIEAPSIFRLERTADPSKHFVLKEVKQIENKAALGEIADKLKASSTRSMLVYVHGYYMSFEDAALRTAQLAHDLKFQGVPFFYSWPSAYRMWAYLKDEDTARFCEPVFEDVIKQISALPVDSIYIVAHSMGNRIVGHGLQAYVDAGHNTKHIKELLLAAPDIDADIFKTAIAPRLAKMQNTRTTIYASSGDIALIASKVVHGFRRVGESEGGVQVFKGFDTIDASEASSATRNFGHSYVVDNTSVINDVGAIIGKHLPAKARGLTEISSGTGSYWQLR